MVPARAGMEPQPGRAAGSGATYHRSAATAVVGGGQRWIVPAPLQREALRTGNPFAFQPPSFPAVHLGLVDLDLAPPWTIHAHRPDRLRGDSFSVALRLLQHQLIGELAGLDGALSVDCDCTIS